MLMQSHTTIKRLASLPELSKAGKRVNGLFRMMESQILWEMAYSKIAPNKGALTPGVDGQTFDGFSLEKVRTLIKRLTEDTYNPQPVRRVYIPKVNGKKRPLGIPTTEDRLVQEVVRMLLEAIYEPVFSEHSHGFRPSRSCHTALEHIRRVWTGMKWLVDVDISGFFDNIDHNILLDLLAKRIDDERFIRLIRGMLKAGYVEDWVHNRTYSGTPQGGVVSPMLANIYLHELDSFMVEQINLFNRGKRRAKNPEALQNYRQIGCLRRRINQRRTKLGEATDVSELQTEIDRLTQERLKTPCTEAFDMNFRRLRYCRYADDFLIGIIGSKQDARDIMDKVTKFLTDSMKLQVSEEKSGIRKATDGARFLGYDVCTYTAKRAMMKGNGTRRTLARSAADRIQLQVPRGRIVEFCQRKKYGNFDNIAAVHRPMLLHASDVEIAVTYNAELRGFATYYGLAKDVKRKLAKLHHIWRASLLKTLAIKHQRSVAQTVRLMRRDTDLAVTFQRNGELAVIPIWKLKHLNPKPVTWATVDVPPPRAHLGSTEIVERLNARQCEYCGRTDAPCEVHHVRKMANMKGTPLHQYLKAARLRKRVVLCKPCHADLHAGRLRDLRALRQVEVESRVR